MTTKPKATRGWAVIDQDSIDELQEYQLGTTFYYMGAYVCFVKKEDAIKYNGGGRAIEVLISPLTKAKKERKK